ncbi:hypothetical protein PTKIN_Ptkin03bG0160600 [Pterospermum kingtungense]
MCMELRLGLALPSTSAIIPIKMFDLNSYGYDPREALGPLLKLGPCDINSSGSRSSSSGSSGGSKKRGFDDEVLLFEEDRIAPKTLPLLLWTNQPNDEDDHKDLDDNSSSAIFKYLISFFLFLFLFVSWVCLFLCLYLNSVVFLIGVLFRPKKKCKNLSLVECMLGLIYRNDGEGLVGWPPVKTWRKKLCRQIPYGGADNNGMEAAEKGCVGRASNSTYVKVKMEGVAIARKIDLSVHNSFETLTSTLMRMFGISDENWKSFKLTYQDREGDWLLAEDVPWRTFIRSLKCLKLIRSRG